MKDYIQMNQKAYDAVAEEYKNTYQNNAGAQQFYEILQRKRLQNLKC